MELGKAREGVSVMLERVRVELKALGCEFADGVTEGSFADPSKLETLLEWALRAYAADLYSTIRSESKTARDAHVRLCSLLCECGPGEAAALVDGELDPFTVASRFARLLAIVALSREENCPWLDDKRVREAVASDCEHMFKESCRLFPPDVVHGTKHALPDLGSLERKLKALEQEEAKLEAKLKVTDGGALFQAEPEAQNSLQAAWARALVGADNYTDTVSKLGLKDARVLGETPGQRQLEAAVEQSTSAIERFQQIAKGLRSIHSDARRCEVLTEAQNPKVDSRTTARVRAALKTMRESEQRLTAAEAK